MNVKRISYFSFLIAISTIATVSGVHAAQAENSTCWQATTIASASPVQEITLECWMALAKALEEKGLQASQFKITSCQQAQGDEQFLLCLEIDKSFKGQVASLTNNAILSEKLPATFTSVVKNDFNSIGYAVDLRSVLKQKSRILRE